METDDLSLEQAHLASSREHLARMRARTESLDSAAAGDWVSQEILQHEMSARLEALRDDPSVPLFFGRLDYQSEHPEGGTAFYIGRRHVSDEIGDPMVVDWRAPISLPFYRASPAEPLGVERRRRFGFRTGQLTALEDESLAGGEAVGYSEILEAEIERPRNGPMRDIVATIQPEQDVIVRADLSESVCVQGAPGTGKTAVGLHRAAYLLYAYRQQLNRQGVLVVGPNDSFLRYIGDVLPALGEMSARQTTVAQIGRTALADLNATYTLTGTESAASATLKGDARMARVLERAVWDGVRVPEEQLVVPRGSRRWRVHSWDAEEIVAELRTRGVRYGAARAMLPQRLAHAVLVKMEDGGDSPDDRVQDAVARSREVKAYVAKLWPAVDPARLVFRLLSEADLLARHAEGILTEGEQALLRWDKPARSPVSTAWTLAESILVDEVTDLVDRTRSVGHLVADEAQDLSAMMLRAIGRRCSTGSATVLGDLAQATTPWAAGSWETSLGYLGKSGSHVEELTRGFRVPGEVIDYAARLLPVIAPGLRPPTSVRRSRGELRFAPSTDVVESLRAELTRDRLGTVGVIVPDAVVASLMDLDLREGTEIVPAALAKGLEFDHVVLLEPAGIVDGEPDRVTGLRRLYVCLTRAVTSLVVVHQRPLPVELGPAAGPPGSPGQASLHQLS